MSRLFPVALVFLGMTAGSAVHALGATAIATPSCSAVLRNCGASPQLDIDDLVLTPGAPQATLDILFEPGASVRLVDTDPDPERVAFGYRLVNEGAGAATLRHAFAFLDAAGDPIPGTTSAFFAGGTFGPGEQVLVQLETVDLEHLLPLDVSGFRMMIELEAGAELTIDTLASFNVGSLDVGSVVVPEPSVAMLFLSGLAGLASSRARA